MSQPNNDHTNHHTSEAADPGSHSSSYASNSGESPITPTNDDKPPHPSETPYRHHETMIQIVNYIEYLEWLPRKEGEPFSVFHDVVCFDPMYQNQIFHLPKIWSAAERCGVLPEQLLHDLIWYVDILCDADTAADFFRELNYWLIARSEHDPIAVLTAYRHQARKSIDEFVARQPTPPERPANAELTELLNAL